MGEDGGKKREETNAQWQNKDDQIILIIQRQVNLIRKFPNISQKRTRESVPSLKYQTWSILRIISFKNTSG